MDECECMDNWLCGTTRKLAADLIRHVRTGRQMMVEDIHILWGLNEEFTTIPYDDLGTPQAQALYYVINHNRLWR